MTERRSIVLTGAPVHPLPAHLVLAEMIQLVDQIGDCPTCRGTGTVIIQSCLAGEPHTPVKDCSVCTGTGWIDRVNRTPHSPLHPHPIPA